MPPDGQSFLPQLLGQEGTPRKWLYGWYARGAGLKNVSESVMTTQYKLYHDGRFFNLLADPFEERAKQIADLSGAEAEAARQLSDVFNQYVNARPAEVAAAAANAPSEGEEESKRPRKSRSRVRRSADAAPKSKTFALETARRSQ
jgi:arylsulfatase A